MTFNDNQYDPIDMSTYGERQLSTFERSCIVAIQGLTSVVLRCMTHLPPNTSESVRADLIAILDRHRKEIS